MGILILACFAPSIFQVLPLAPNAELLVRDMTGEEVPLEGLPQRVFIGANILAPLAMVDEGVDRVAAASQNGKYGSAKGLVDRIYPGIAAVPSSGSSAEDLLRLRPDVILAWNVHSKELIETGLRHLIQLRIDDKSPTASRIQLWTLLGQVTGQTARVNHLIARYFDQIGKISACISPSVDSPPRVAILMLEAGVWWIGRRGHYYNDLLQLAGATNPVRDVDWGIFGLEQLIALDPDIILLTDFGDNIAPNGLYEVREMNAVRAVRMHRVYRIPSQPLFSAPVMDPLLIRWMTELFYPDVMEKELRDAYRSTYRYVFEYELSEDEIDEALFMKGNLTSVGYQRFLVRPARTEYLSSLRRSQGCGGAVSGGEHAK